MRVGWQMHEIYTIGISYKKEYIFSAYKDLNLIFRIFLYKSFKSIIMIIIANFDIFQTLNP